MTAILRLANPPATAEVLRDLIADYRAHNIRWVGVDELEAALDKLEANGWVLPKPTVENPGLA